MSKIQDELTRIEVYKQVLDDLQSVSEYCMEDSKNHLEAAKNAANEFVKMEDTWQYETYLSRMNKASICKKVYDEILDLALWQKK